MRLINADALKNDFDVQYFVNNERVFDIPQIKAFVDIAPTVEAKPVVHGYWIEGRGVLSKFFKCNKCGSYHEFKSSYCSSCGADMRGEKHD